ncbi:MAG: F0F1 ATP synthase subunit alpha [bacterium]
MSTIDKKYLEQIQSELNNEIAKLIEINQKPSGGHIDEGFVESFADGIGVISGLEKAKIGQKLQFPTSTKRAGEEIFGQIIDIDENTVSCIVFGEERFVKEKDKVLLDKTQDVLSVFASEAQLGHVVDPFGRPIDLEESDEEEPAKDMSNDLVEVWSRVMHKKTINSKEYKYIPVERDAPPLISRSPISTPLQTGIKAIDTMMPIGLGQRMLVIGDRGTGKSAVAIACMLHQLKINKFRDEKDKIVFIYVAIGKKISEIKSIKHTIKRTVTDYDVSDNTIIVATKANDPAALLYIAPFAGCSIGEYFRDRGKQAVIIYDDLTKHANAYRHISLLLKRAPGREAFPGDIFYLHSRLLERAASVYYEENDNGDFAYSKPKYGEKQTVGTLTSFPLIETKENDYSAYIPTNVISITDGQIYLDIALFNEEILPAVHTGLSVSRVGSKAQTPLMKQLSKNLKADLAIYKEKKKFQSFGFDLSAEDKIIVNHGERAYAYLKQALNETTMEKDQLTDLAKIEIQKIIETEYNKNKNNKTMFGKDFNSSAEEILNLAFEKYAKSNKLVQQENETEEKYNKKFNISGFKNPGEFKELIIKDTNLISFINEILIKEKEPNGDNPTT